MLQVPQWRLRLKYTLQVPVCTSAATAAWLLSRSNDPRKTRKTIANSVMIRVTSRARFGGTRVSFTAGSATPRANRSRVARRNAQPIGTARICFIASRLCTLCFYYFTIHQLGTYYILLVVFHTHAYLHALVSVPVRVSFFFFSLHSCTV